MKILVKIYFSIVLVTWFIFTGNLTAQNRQAPYLPSFNYDVVVFPGENAEKSRVDIYIWVSNTQLQYLKKDTLYLARYQVNFEIYKDQNVALLTEDTTATVVEKSYAATIDPNVQQLHHFQYRMVPNKYLFRIRLLDLNSGSSRVEEIEKNVQVGSKNLEISDFLVLNTDKINQITVKNVLPRLRVPIQDRINIYAEVRAPESTREFTIEAIISRPGQAKQFRLANTIKASFPLTIIFLEIPGENMILGLNQLTLRVTTGLQTKEITNSIRFIRSGDSYGLTTGSLAEMIEQLKYVAEGDEWQNIRRAVGADQEKFFQEFWQKRDPTPETGVNELFNEYYNRVTVANQQFSTGQREGWRSDRGRVFIIYGRPDSIDKFSQSGNSISSYEVWYYQDLRKKFVFLDESGFGDYRLVSGNL